MFETTAKILITAPVHSPKFPVCCITCFVYKCICDQICNKGPSPAK